MPNHLVVWPSQLLWAAANWGFGLVCAVPSTQSRRPPSPEHSSSPLQQYVHFFPIVVPFKSEQVHLWPPSNQAMRSLFCILLLVSTTFLLALAEGKSRDQMQAAWSLSAQTAAGSTAPQKTKTSNACTSMTQVITMHASMVPAARPLPLCSHTVVAAAATQMPKQEPAGTCWRSLTTTTTTTIAFITMEST